MRHVLLFFIALSALLAISCAPADNLNYLPVPEKTVDYDLDESPRKWQMQTFNRSVRGFLTEFVPEGQRVENWNEMVSQQIKFTSMPADVFVENWRAGLTRVDSSIVIKNEILDDGSLLLTYETRTANEFGIRKFMQGPDGIYMLAYHARPDSRQDEITNRWMQIIRASSLVKNPLK